jgi:pimeloyl-ACP methyl ester carboxylesterase
MLTIYIQEINILTKEKSREMSIKVNKFMKIVRNIFIGLLIIVVSWICIHQALTLYEKYKYKAPGMMVEVDNKKIHVYEQGEGANTIVLLSGLGTASPVLDFGPLTDKLSKNNKVVVVEGFGYGWSDLTEKERSVENIVEEIRTALSKANIPGPYILMPHSISGIYAMYYANTYPEEVKAVVGIDCTLPKMGKYFGEQIPSAPGFMGWLAPSGIVRIGIMLDPENYLPVADKGIYSEENLKITKAISAWRLDNKNVISEINELSQNINKTMDMKFPKELPVLLFARKDTKKPREDGKNSINFYETYLKGLYKGELVVLDGHHYLHWSCSDEMSNAIEVFLKDIK